MHQNIKALFPALSFCKGYLVVAENLYCDRGFYLLQKYLHERARAIPRLIIA